MSIPKKQKMEVKESSEESEEAEQALGLYCNEKYSTSPEGSISFLLCKKLAHISCAGIDSHDDESVLYCELWKPYNRGYYILPRLRLKDTQKITLLCLFFVYIVFIIV